MLDQFFRLIRGFVVDRRGTAHLVSRRTALDFIAAAMAIVTPQGIIIYSGADVALAALAHGHGLGSIPEISLAVTAIMLAAAWYGVLNRSRSGRGLRQIQPAAMVDLERAPDLAEREQAVLRYLADVSHGLRTPLTGILGFADLMKNESRGPLGDEKYAEYVERIRDDSSHMLAIVDDLLTMSQLDGGVAATDERPTRVDEAIRAAVRTVLPDNGAGGGRIILQVEPDLPLLQVGEHDLRKMLHNLMDNALRFRRRREDGPATVAARVDYRSELVISVSDTGIGMVGSDIDMALSRFGRVDHGDGDAVPGTGLGLPLTKALADRYGARLEIHSERGVGTIVNLRFPADRVLTGMVDENDGKAEAAA
jgi:signal transduction histidine kinase